jgi:16S rRNA (guanine966-N2)-methyltransferase
MRVIAGSRKGHRLAAPKGADTRPTGDRVREAAFMLIGPVEDMAVLDLFAGSGAMGSRHSRAAPPAPSSLSPIAPRRV